MSLGSWPRDLSGRTAEQDQALWILTQASRERMVRTYADLPAVTWKAYIRRHLGLKAVKQN